MSPTLQVNRAPYKQRAGDTPIERLAKDRDGYRYWYDAGHPLARSNGKVYLHRVVASFSENRWLEPDEIIWFKDGNSDNVSPENLELISRNEAGRRSKGREHPEKRKFEITPEDIKVAVWKTSILALAKERGVSDNAIRKRCKKYGIKAPRRDIGRKSNMGLPTTVPCYPWGTPPKISSKSTGASPARATLHI